ncbi:RNA-directed DNA polymerase, eukaryota, reverse transcriptase zinc-binding domain protein [Tanacetum coccineum]
MRGWYGLKYRVYLYVLGVPMAIKKVASLVGRFMFFEDDHSATMSIGRVCITTKQMNFIYEVVKVDINGEEFDVHIHELGSWSINIADDQSSNSSESVFKKDEEVLNDDGEASEGGDFNELFQEEQDWKNEEDKIESENIGETIHSNVANNVQGQETNQKTEEIKEINRWNWSIVGGSMNVLSINVRGTKKRKKCVWIKELCFKNNIHFLGVQESKMTRFELYRIKSMWGNYAFYYACSMPRGRSRGLISVWDPNYFVKDQIWCDDYFIIVQGKWANSDEVFYMINIYGPHETVAKTSLWSRMMDFIVTHEGHYIIFGDMNEVHDESERYGTVFSRLEAHTFNSFIDDTCLADLPLGGRSYTWMNKAGTKMSKLDRFLVSNSVMDAFPYLKEVKLRLVEIEGKIDKCVASDENNMKDLLDHLMAVIRELGDEGECLGGIILPVTLVTLDGSLGDVGDLIWLVRFVGDLHLLAWIGIDGCVSN